MDGRLLVSSIFLTLILLFLILRPTFPFPLQTRNTVNLERYAYCLSVALVEKWYEEVKGYFTNSIAWVFKYPSPTDSLKEDIL